MKCPLSRGGGEINQRIRAIQSGWTRQQPPLFLIEKKSPATLPILFDRPPSRVTLHGFGTERQMIDRIEIYSVEHIFASNRVSAAYSCWILQQALCTLGLNKVLGGCMKAKGDTLALRICEVTQGTLNLYFWQNSSPHLLLFSFIGFIGEPDLPSPHTFSLSFLPSTLHLLLQRFCTSSFIQEQIFTTPLISPN